MRCCPAPRSAGLSEAQRPVALGGQPDLLHAAALAFGEGGAISQTTQAAQSQMLPLLNPGARLVFEVGEPYDQLRVTGALDIGVAALGFSDFQFSNKAGFGPGQSYVLIAAASVTGAFGAGETTGLVDGLPCTLAVLGTDVVLTSNSGRGTVILVR